ncbi:MAG TPA: OmpW family outer membrane protein [Methylophilaceae bacterium]|nr:OmpW family outer membrane protein [Methylophilaceae bacterium]
MKKTLLAVMMAAAFAPAVAMAEQGDFVVRLRATNISPAVNSHLGQQTDQTYGASTANLLYGSSTANLEVESNTIPEVDFSYYVTNNIALELILALGSRHDVNVSGSGGAVNNSLGDVNLLPPTLTAQWHFMPDQKFDPYVGAGVTYVRSLDTGLKADAGAAGTYPIRIDHNMWGPAVQLGFDVNMQDRWLVNFDVKKIWLETDVELLATPLKAGYQKIDSLDIDPWVISVGVGKKF